MDDREELKLQLIERQLMEIDNEIFALNKEKQKLLKLYNDSLQENK